MPMPMSMLATVAVAALSLIPLTPMIAKSSAMMRSGTIPNLSRNDLNTPEVIRKHGEKRDEEGLDLAPDHDAVEFRHRVGGDDVRVLVPGQLVFLEALRRVYDIPGEISAQRLHLQDDLGLLKS